jgi:hypothetical protein
MSNVKKNEPLDFEEKHFKLINKLIRLKGFYYLIQC